MARGVLLRSALAALSAAALALPAAASGEPASHPAAKQPLLVHALVSTRAPGRRVSRSYAGFSVDYTRLLQLIGNVKLGPNPVLAALFRKLSAGSGVPLLRVGGAVQDEAWWNPDRTGQKPVGMSYDITTNFTDALSAFVASAGTPLMIGLNLAQPDPAVAVDWAREATARFGSRRIKAFELGNEPDIYYRRPYGRNPDGSEHLARPRSYTFGRYLNDYDAHAAALKSLHVPLAGPAACCLQPWFRPGNTGAFVKTERRRGLKLLTYHWYPQDACGKKRGDRGYPTIGRLLAEKVVGFPGQRFSQLAKIARHFKVSTRVSETNSVACGGATGVSNTLGSALWGADWMFQLAAGGVRGINFHIAGLNAPFAVSHGTSGWFVNVRPLYYGMLLFSRATAHRAKILLTGRKRGRKRNVKVWATLDRRRTLRIVAINKSISLGGVVKVQVFGSRRRGSLVRLLGGGASSTGPVTWAGQSFATPTSDARLEGSRVERRVRPRRGVYRFRLPAASAAMLTIRKAPR